MILRGPDGSLAWEDVKNSAKSYFLDKAVTQRVKKQGTALKSVINPKNKKKRRGSRKKANIKGENYFLQDPQTSGSVCTDASATYTHRLVLGHIEHLATEGSGGADLYGNDSVVVRHKVGVGVPHGGLLLVLPQQLAWVWCPRPSWVTKERVLSVR